MLPPLILNKIINNIRLFAKRLNSTVDDLTINAYGIIDDAAISLLIKLHNTSSLSAFELATLYHALSPEDRLSLLGGNGAAFLANIAKEHTPTKQKQDVTQGVKEQFTKNTDTEIDNSLGVKFDIIGYNLFVTYPDGTMEDLGRVVGRGGSSSSTVTKSGGVIFANEAPDIPSNMPFWYNTNNGSLYVIDNYSDNPEWIMIGGGSLPAGGEAGEVLTKVSGIDGDATWQPIQPLSNVSYNDLTDVPTEFNPSSHTHVISDITGLENELSGKVDNGRVLTDVPLGAVFTDTVYTDDDAITAITSSASWKDTEWNLAYSWGDHSEAGYALQGELFSGDYNELINIPTEFNPSSHTHLSSDITDITDVIQQGVANHTHLSDGTVVIIDGDVNLANIYIKEEVDALLETKVDKETGKQLSTEDYTTLDKNKLANISEGATVNSTDEQLRDRSTHTGTQPISSVYGLQSSLDNKSNTGHSHVLKDITDAGDIASININGSTTNYLRGDGNWVTPPNTTYTAGTGLTLVGTEFQNTAPHIATNLGYIASTRTLTSSTGEDVILPEAATATAGLMSGEDKTKLNSLQNVNLVSGDNITITGSYPNLTISSAMYDDTTIQQSIADLEATVYTQSQVDTMIANAVNEAISKIVNDHIVMQDGTIVAKDSL